MVWLISFLTVTNIAMGYGLAVYVQQQFGTAVPNCGPLSFRKSAGVPAPPVASEVTTVSSAPPSETSEEKRTRVQESAPAEPATDPVARTARESNETQPPDEENVLAGIAEFRSQLAKMNVAPEENVEAATEAEELATAAS